VSDILLATKFHIPPVHGKLIHRPHLIQRLNDGVAQCHRLTLISAPAGYGKSTLLSEWASQVGMPVAWLSLEKAENIPTRFWTYFVTALSSNPHLNQAAFCEALLQALRSPHPPPMEVVLTNLMNELTNVEGEAILVLDDLHTIKEGQIHQDLVFLIDHLPRSGSGLHLVIASRMDPPWPLARWRVRGELTEIRTKELRFSPKEASTFLNDVMGLKLTSQDIALLDQRTEGWIAGLQMAALSMQGRLTSQGPEGISRFIETFKGSNRFILDYLMEEVIHQQPEAIREFLYKTSILEQLCAPLCDALLGCQDSQSILDQVETANLFLLPLDDKRYWYRYHTLFADLLRKFLKQSQPGSICELHQRASDWYTANNFLSEAISHALDAGDVMRVNKVVSGNALAMTEHAELQDVLWHFEQMPESEICAKPWLCVAYAWTKAYVDPSQEIGGIIKEAMESISGVDDALERQHLISQLDAIWAYVAWVKGEAETALEFARTALKSLPDDDWMTRSHVLHTQGSALQFLGRLPESIRSFEAAIIAGQKMNQVHGTFYAYTSLAYINILQGDLHQAYSLCQKVLALADQAGLVTQRLPILAYAYATMSMVQREWNEVEAAIYNAREAVALAEQWRQADTLHFSLTCLSEALCAAGDLEAAFAATQRGMQLAVNVSPWFVRISMFNQIIINLAKGAVDEAATQFAQLEDATTEQTRKGIFLVAKASLLNALGRFPDTLSLVDQEIDEIEQKGGVWIKVQLLPLQALALQALDREEESLEVLGRCLALARPEGYVRIFLDQGAPMLRLLQAALGRGIEVEYINKLIPSFGISTSSTAIEEPGSFAAQPQYRRAVLIEPLSERELQVLRLLDSPLTSEEISRELYVSVNTIRTHIRNIYSKLGVKRRGDAVRLAKERKLM
jgi:LuxR family maltose regulon positive regulatory protein